MPIYPPQGPCDKGRYDSLKTDDRDYGTFCVEFCSMILERRPDQLEALEVAANHFTEMGYFSDGLALDEHLLQLRPDDPGVLYNLACSQALVGRIDDAILSLSRSVQYGYRNHRHMAADRDLDRLHGDVRFHELLARMKTSSP